MLHRTSSGCCESDIGMSRAKVPHYCDHGSLLVYVHGLSDKTKDPPGARGKRSTLKRGRGFAASKAQREKVKGLPCVGCGTADGEEFFDGGEPVRCDPAHLWPRGMGGCDDAQCVIPLCRACHRAFDEGKLDLLPRLIDGKFFPEMAHAIEAHELSPLTLLERLTGQEWSPPQTNKEVVAQ